MRLQIITPLSVAVDAPDVRALRAEDASGISASCPATRSSSPASLFP